MEVTKKWRRIGGGFWNGEDVTLEINDETGKIEMIYWGEWKINGLVQ